MVRAIARQAEAERERRAKVIHAEGEMQAAEKLRDAAAMLSQQPQALQLRYLQTMADMANNGKSSTIVFPLPLDLIRPLMERVSAESGFGYNGLIPATSKRSWMQHVPPEAWSAWDSA